MTRIEREMMRGAGPLAVMQLLGDREMYGYELVEALDRRSDGVLAMGQSTVYPLLYNLEAKGLVHSRWEKSESGRKRKYYGLTRKGEKELAVGKQQWRSLVEAMARLEVLDARPILADG